MTVCRKGTVPGDVETAMRTQLRITADGAYAAWLIPSQQSAGTDWHAERWTLDGPEPYVVPLPASRPEEPDSELLPLPDGRVLILRRAKGRFSPSLLYPAGLGTGELTLGTVPGERLTLLPPSPGTPARVHALAVGEDTTTVWLIYDGVRGPQPIAEVPGRCAGGVWLDRAGRLLALDRADPRGRTKTVAVDLERGGEVTPLLQISQDSDDRLLLADVDSGLLLIRSNAPGEERLGWGLLGGHRPVHFPHALRLAGVRLTPFAIQPDQALLPERCAVALRADGHNGTWLALWRPAEGTLRQLAPPLGWLPGVGVWTREGELRLPFTTWQTPCGVARIRLPAMGTQRRAIAELPAGSATRTDGAARPVPLQHAPLARAR